MILYIVFKIKWKKNVLEQTHFIHNVWWMQNDMMNVMALEM